MTATPMEIDFSKAVKPSLKDISNDKRPTTAEGKLLTAKQIRARARRRLKRGETGKKLMTKEEFEALYKPVEEWDLEELARGRPRDVNGGFKGRTPSWVDRGTQEKAMNIFTDRIKAEMSTMSVTALKTLNGILTSEATDERGKPIVPASTKAQVAMGLLEHTVGKPKQHVTQDISVKLQGILASVMVNPAEALAPPSQGGQFGDQGNDTPGYSLAHFPGQTMPLGQAEDDDLLDETDAPDIVEGELLD
jgi:hypothetical protein